ncbi:MULTISPECIES: hypothetical protein [Aquimarina]|uniref:Uncharacterized protein n=1 Tax=Aquimarina algiphila TaxID=2047982 RepID=A0A554VS33_9FLAO|nr:MULTISPECIES: hypothetical protein [Aquimarina]TSE11501.1 hypothetical protein FOF46_00530 [Aquimarina algiphila]
MLKSILNLNNVKTLSKQQQEEVKGAAFVRPTCSQNGSQCTQSDQYGIYTDYGRCQRSGICFWS